MFQPNARRLEELTYEGTGRANFSTRSTGFLQPSFNIISRRESTVSWICGRIKSTWSRVKRGSTMLLSRRRTRDQIRLFSPFQCRKGCDKAQLPLLHMLRLVHIHKSRFVVCCGLSACIHFGEAGTGTLLELTNMLPNF